MRYTRNCYYCRPLHPEDTYRTLAAPSEGTFSDRGSKFLGYAYPVSSVEEIREILADLKKAHPSARHVCYAFRINPLNEYARDNDDGEPSSSAGKPIAGQIKSANLMNVLVAVVRYFGGTLLGVPGLINAYKTAAKEALDNARIINASICTDFVVTVGYEQSGELMSWIKSSGYQWQSPDAGAEFSVKIEIPRSRTAEAENFLTKKQWRYSID